jgi:hypothetical protein
MHTQNKTALVTGASSGIGAAVAEVLASQGFDLVVTARREARLKQLAERLALGYNAQVTVIPCDLIQPRAVSRLWSEMEEAGTQIDILVNSAGFGSAGAYAHIGWATHRNMLEAMVVVTSELTHRLLPGMVERRYGRIINVASLAGLVHAGAGTLYEAAKAFAVRFSVSLHSEVRCYGVHVTAVCPGLTRTEFHEVPALRATVSGMPSWLWMNPADVATGSVRAVMAGQPIYVPGVLNRLLLAGLTYTPRACLRAASAGGQLLRRIGSRSAQLQR